MYLSLRIAFGLYDTFCGKALYKMVVNTLEKED